jgi:glutamate formiminotransferase
VPNISEGRRGDVLAALAAAVGPGHLLDLHPDPVHNRAVVSMAGSAESIEARLLALVAESVERIDLRRHEGAHPRIGAADVVPVVPIRPEDMSRAQAAAALIGARIGAELELPVFVYDPPARGPAFYRRGDLAARLAARELAPDYGPAHLHETAGGVILGARPPLIAFNVNLRGSLSAAKAVAAAIRERGGGFPGVRALGLELPSAKCVQVSMNVEDWEAAALHEIVDRIRVEAAQHGAEVLGSELVGLMPAGAAAAAAGPMLEIDGFDASRLLELRLLDA